MKEDVIICSSFLFQGRHDDLANTCEADGSHESSWSTRASPEVLTFFPFSRYLWELLVYQTMIHQSRNSVYIEPIFQVGDRNDKHTQKYTNKFQR